MFTSAPPITKMHQKDLFVWFKATSVKIWNLVLITFIWSVAVDVSSLILSAILKSHCLPLNMFYKYTAWPKRSRHLDLTKLLSISLSLDNYCSDYLMQLATCHLINPNWCSEQTTTSQNISRDCAKDFRLFQKVIGLFYCHLYIVRDPTELQRNPNNETTPYEQAPGDSWKEKIRFNGKKPPVETTSRPTRMHGRLGSMPWVWGESESRGS